MKAFFCVVALTVCALNSPPTWSHANEQPVQQHRGDTDKCVASPGSSAAHADSTSKPPRISVGVSYPDTQLNLPWFLTDIINAVNTHQSPRCLLHTLGNDF